MIEDIVFSFNDVKATQAAAFFIKRQGQPSISYLGLLKMLYISDRTSLERNGYPITGDQFVSMKYGPVLTRIYDYVKPQGGRSHSEYWSEYIATVSAPHNPEKKVFVTLIADPGDDELSLDEEAIMESVYQKFGSLNPFDVAEWTHSLPEWIDPKTLDQKVVNISVINLLHYLKMSDEQIQRIKAVAERERYLDGVLNG
ncbi:Panacea domain-containing protein [Spirulina major CS-329]|uniref:Panacea domain-containing protein n=1 Tax=Spirulina TaxID=1154 RepID=UPI00232DEF0B|nr:MULTISPECIES: Panacea domain-containing protein [Spirulina]MDB9495539.1 Panacea domain-containing protein [Spirulina subsalsa CS-330]MDB9504306.1 Panacea domain-containing protein [Spirulina major CS-329]